MQVLRGGDGREGDPRRGRGSSSLHLLSEYPPAPIAGLGRYGQGLTRALAALGDEVHVLTNSFGGQQDDVVVDGVHLHRVASPNPPRPSTGVGEVLQWNHGVVARALDRRTALARVDVVVAHGWLAAIAGREVARELGRPLVATFHDEALGKHQGVLDEAARVAHDLEALLAREADLIVTNSAYVARRLQRTHDVAAERLGVALGGVDPGVVHVDDPAEVVAARAALAAPGQPLVLYVGRLEVEKGVETLARAVPAVLARRPDARFVFAGAGRLEPKLRARLGPRAAFLGHVDGPALARLYRAADLVVVPSVYEALGLVPLEALCAGTPVVASATGGLPEVVRHGVDGLLVAPGAPGPLAEAIGDLLDDPGRRRDLAAAGRARALETFSWERVALTTRDLYARALAAGERREVTPPASSAAGSLAAVPLASAPLASVLLVTREAPAHAEAALRSVVGRTAWRPLEVVVVDDGSSPAAQAHLERVCAELTRPDVPVRFAPRDPAHATALAQALAAARGALVCAFADEAEVPPGGEGWLDGLAWLLDEREAGSASPGASRRDTQDGDTHDDGPGDAPGAVVLWRRVPGSTSAPPGPRVVHPTVRLFHHAGEALRDAAAPLSFSAASRLPVTIVMVAYKGLELTRAALEAVRAHTAPPYELVLVCNGARDGTREHFFALRDALGGRVAVQVLDNDENLGYPVAANQGLRAARGRDVVLLNNDTRVRAGWLDALLRARRATPGAGVVSPKVLNLDGTVQAAGGVVHTPDGGFALPHAGEDRLAPPVCARREVVNAGGPCMLLTRELLERVGLLDEAYSPAYFEDTDLCLRAREAGLVLVYEPEAELYHHGQATSSLVAREGTLDVWGGFEVNRRRFHARWNPRLAADEAARRERASGPTPRQTIVLCYHRSDTTTAVYLERALRREHDVITAGSGQELDLGDEASARDLIEAAAGRVDLLLVVEGETYVPRELEDAPCPTALWAIDNHLHARVDGAGHLSLGRAFDHLFVAQPDYFGRFRAAGLAPVWLPLACEPEAHLRASAAAPRDLGLVFVGHVRPFHARRRRVLDRLAARFGLEERQGLFGADMADLYARAKVVVNCSLAGDLNMRVFEGLASGALVLTDRCGNGLQTFFADGEHLALFDDRDVERVVERYLDDAPRRVAVAARGQRLVTRHHTYQERARALLRGVRAGRPRRRLACVRPLELEARP